MARLSASIVLALFGLCACASTQDVSPGHVAYYATLYNAERGTVGDREYPPDGAIQLRDVTGTEGPWDYVMRGTTPRCDGGHEWIFQVNDRQTSQPWFTLRCDNHTRIDFDSRYGHIPSGEPMTRGDT